VAQSRAHEFIDYLNSFGKFRYLEVSNFAFGGNIVTSTEQLGNFVDFALSLKNFRSCHFTMGSFHRNIESQVDSEKVSKNAQNA
jgi:hypothetical protein